MAQERFGFVRQLWGQGHIFRVSQLATGALMAHLIYYLYGRNGKNCKQHPFAYVDITDALLCFRGMHIRRAVHNLLDRVL